jgi:maltooligosyltrehalose trehalohydrolase
MQHRADRPPGISRRLPIGAEVQPDGVHFRVWAPSADQLTVVTADPREQPLKRDPEGYFAGFVPGLGHGDRYRYRLDRGEPLPDPASRCQPQGPLGPSMVVDPGRYRWGDAGWAGVSRFGQVVCELHVGTFTQEGTWRAASERLPHLADVGITVIEMMPVNEFAGRFGWGYDGVDLFAPTRLYGEPDDLRAFVDAAHAQGIGVILDVIYNHLGPVGNILKSFAPSYFSERYCTEWGETLNFDGPGCLPVREFVVANACCWVDEFHLDGFRIDATQNIYDFDEDHEHILAEIARRARETAGRRELLIIGENEPQIARLVRPRDQGGHGLDALWNDDFHHSAVVAFTGRHEAYYTDHGGRPQEFVSAAKHGFLFQGQRYRWQQQARGTPTRDLGPERFVNFIENHDQLANSGNGRRLHRTTDPGSYRAMTALLLLMPGTPMLFQGQEFASSAPFHYFADFDGELAEKVDRGRREFVAQFPSLARPEVQETLPRPDDPETFAGCKLDWSEVETHHETVALHRDLLRLRREDPTLRLQERGGIDGAVLGENAFVLRFFGPAEDDRLLLVNLGVDLELHAMPEPLLAPPEGHDWRLLWSSEHPAYGGSGAPAPSPDEAWVLPGHAALVMTPGPASPSRKSELQKALDLAARIRCTQKGDG